MTEVEQRNLIGGEWVAAADGYEVVNPATEAPVGSAPNATPDDAAAACAALVRLLGWMS